ncbi:S41 family peptidase [Desulfobotulus sp.]|jgi:carboxyl-terminal processing protease|uniref:S41 family peptidase n=1 Tax=Desulfobotulus sp. TaxID=1940337 RepID=UPI002A36ADAD|nr:S41 family peptidase [Desulfobotulus sp.]MDY0163481.1 S41 family peptidase [Desulfobotulus sp.]
MAFKFLKMRHLMVAVSIVALVILGSASFHRTVSAKANTETYKGLKVFSDVIEEIEANYVDEVKTEDLIQKAIQGMVGSLDPHSAFLPPEAFEELQMDTKGEFGGIGIVITTKNGLLTVISPIEGTPAFKAGIQAEDVIVEVDGESTKDMMLWEAVKRMRGPKGEKVLIRVVRKGVSEPIEFTLVRDLIPIDSVRYALLRPGYGYVWVTNFRENTTEDLKKALEEIKQKGELKGLVLDLRGNPGGLLDQAVSVSDLFLEGGDIVSIQGRKNISPQIFKARKRGTEPNYPIVVLINAGSASASEIVAGALQDHKRAVILGTTSFGKGSVQTVRPLKDGYALKYTIARYFTPLGRSIQAEGIEPDIRVAQRILEEDTEAESRMLHERDLRNHIEKKDAPQKEETKMPVVASSGLDMERLMKDQQVQRALDILVGYGIFGKGK